MPPVPVLILFVLAPGADTPARAGETSAGGGAFGIGLDIGMAFVILLAVLIAVSVLSKLAIVFGLVPRRPETSGHALVHAMANFVGGLTRRRPRRGDDFGADGR